MNKLIHYNLLMFLRQRSSYIVSLSGVILLSLASILKNLSSEHLGGTMGGMYLMLFFITSLIFVLYSTLSSFGTKSNEGLNILLASKPFSRLKIFASQVLSNLIIIVANTLLLSTLMCFILLFEGASGINLFLQYLSLIFGSIIISFIFASLIALATLVFNTQALSTIALTTIFVIPMASSFSTTFLNRSFTGTSNFKYGTFDKDIENIYYLDSRGYETQFHDQSAIFNEVKHNPYNVLAWFDPWVQLKDLYNVFTPNRSSVIKWKEDTVKIDESSLTVNIDGKDYLILLKYPHQFSDRSEDMYNHILKSNTKEMVSASKDEINALTWESQMYFFSLIFARGTNVMTQAIFDQQLENAKSKTDTWAAFGNVDYYSFKLWNAMTKELGLTFNGSNIDVNELIQNKNDSKILLFEKGSSINVFTSSPIIPKYAIVLIWLFIFTACVATSLYIYIKKY